MKLNKILFATLAVCVLGLTACSNKATVGETAVDSTCNICDTVTVVTDTIK